MLWAALAYSLGIVAGVYLWRPTLWWVVAGAMFRGVQPSTSRGGALAWVGRLPWERSSLRGPCTFKCAVAATRLDTSIDPYAGRQELQITAHVTRDGRLQQRGLNEIRQILDVETEAIQTTPGQSDSRPFQHPPQHLQPAPQPRRSGGKLRPGPSQALRRDARLPLRRPHPFLCQAQAAAQFSKSRRFRLSGISRRSRHRRAGLPPKLKRSNGFPGFPAAGSPPGAAACTAASSPRCTSYGLRARRL